MSGEKEQVVVCPHGSLQIEIVQQVDGGQWKPRHAEYCHHSYQHPAEKSKIHQNRWRVSIYYIIFNQLLYNLTQSNY